MRAAAAAGALLVAACGGEPPAPPNPDLGRWHVSGGFLRAPDGRAAMLRGANVSSAHKRPPYFDFHGPADWARLRDDWGLGAVRFLVSWAAIEPEEGVFDDAYLDAVAARVAQAGDAGLAVVLDLHQDVYGEGFSVGNGAPAWTCPAENYAAFTPEDPWYVNYTDPAVVACYGQFWASDALRGHYRDAAVRLAERLAAEPAVVGLDPMNEPYWGDHDLFTFEAEVLSPFYEDVGAAVREVAPDWLLFLEPSSSRNLGFPTGLLPPSLPRVVYAPHSYDRDAEAGQPFDLAQREVVLGKLEDLAAEARALGAGLWLGEYGTQSGIANAAPYMDAEIDGMERVLAAGAYWHYGKDGGYGLLDDAGAEKADVLGAVVRPVPERIGGAPTAWSWDDATRAFALSFVADGAPTEVRVPARLYPGGAAVTCERCVATWSGDVLEVRAALGAEASLALAPP